MPVPVISVKEMREWESRTWDSGIREKDVIDQVGRRIAGWIGDHIPSGSRIVLLAGKGNNGADVRAASEALPDDIFQVLTLEAREPKAAIQRLESLRQTPPDLIVDGLFGIGLNGGLSGEWKKLVELINWFEVPVLSIDCPSGLNTDSGEVETEAVRATWTLTIGAVKEGLVSPKAAPWTGRLLLAAHVGLHPDGPKSHSKLSWTCNEDFAERPAHHHRAIQGHKGNYGHALIVAGSPGYSGAAVLAARAAQVTQPGLISVLTVGDSWIPVSSNLLAPMVHRFTPHILDEVRTRATSILIGPGLAGPEARNYVYPALQDIWTHADIPVVVDASALDWIPSGPVETDSLRVITPHPGEAARMLHRCGDTESTPNADRLHTAESLSSLFGSATVVLKGNQTLTFSPAHQRTFINPTGNPHLAQGGAGDALAGLIAGALAHPATRMDRDLSLHQILRSVWLHGAAADSLQFESLAWTIDDLLEQLKVPPIQQVMVSPD